MTLSVPDPVDSAPRFSRPYAAAVFGASRGIGLALARRLCADSACQRLYAFCRRPQAADALQSLAGPSAGGKVRIMAADLSDAASLDRAMAPLLAADERLTLLINAVGTLHEPGGLQPERRLEAIDGDALLHSLQVNAVGALLLAQRAMPLLRHGDPAWFACLSARVGSIGDNRLGGWYAYRGAKAALNQYLRTLSIEWRRRAPGVCVLALHPGTVDTDLSRPFGSVAGRPRSSPDQAARNLLDLIARTSAADSGRFLAWDGTEIPW